MLIQIDVPKELNKDVKIETIERENNNMSETIIQIIEEYFEKKETTKQIQEEINNE